MAPKRKSNTERVSTFLSPEHLRMLEEEAEEKGTTVSGLIRMLLIEHLTKK